MPEGRKVDASPAFGKWLIGGIVLSFAIGTLFFFTIATQRSGEPIPPDATPNYFIEDAAPS